MSPLEAFPQPSPTDPPAVARHNRVRVPDGRLGEVIGFYRTKDEHMLVLLDTGGSKRYPRAALRLLR